MNDVPPPREAMRLIEHLPFEMDGGISERARIGLIVLATDYTIEHEWRLIFRSVPGVALYQSRIFNDDAITPETLRAMEPRIAEAARLVLPGAELASIAFGCTSASMAIGEDNVFARIAETRPGVACTTPVTAARAAFAALGAKRIAVLTPYRADVNRIVAAYFQERNLRVPVFGSFNEESDSKVARISPASVKAGIREVLRHGQADAVFVSCTSVRLAEAAARIEREIGIPVTSSNHAMAWHALRLAGINDRLPQWGRVFSL